MSSYQTLITMIATFIGGVAAAQTSAALSPQACMMFAAVLMLCISPFGRTLPAVLANAAETKGPHGNGRTQQP